MMKSVDPLATLNTSENLSQLSPTSGVSQPLTSDNRSSDGLTSSSLSLEEEREKHLAQEFLAKGYRGPWVAIQAVRIGALPGVSIPKETPDIPVEIQPEDFAELGLEIYAPKQETHLLAVLFNPLQISLPELQYLDQKKLLSQIFPPITRWLQQQAEIMESPQLGGPIGSLQPPISAPANKSEGLPAAPPTPNLPPIINRPKRASDRTPVLPVAPL